jgi:hypothetical protein
MAGLHKYGYGRQRRIRAADPLGVNEAGKTHRVQFQWFACRPDTPVLVRFTGFMGASPIRSAHFPIYYKDSVSSIACAKGAQGGWPVKLRIALALNA